MLRALPIAATLLALVPTPAEAQLSEPREGVSFFDTGPLRIEEQFLLSAGFLNLAPSSAGILDRGGWQVDFVQSVTNNWSASTGYKDLLGRRSREPVSLEDLRSVEPEGDRGVFFADGELYRTSLSVRYGLGRRLQLAVTVPLLDFQGGSADSVIEGFHDTFGFGQSGRLGTPRDGYLVYLRDEEGRETVRSRDPGLGVGDVTVGLKWGAPLESDLWLLAVEGVAKLATGDETDLYSTGSHDVGAQVLVTRYGERSCIHVGLGAARLGEAEAFGLDSQTRVSGFASYEHALGRTSSVILQAQVAESPFQDSRIDDLDEEAYLFDLGVKHALSSRTIAFVALTENVVNFGSSADVGLHVGLTWTRDGR
ncbi:MAG: DUF3187 family protein [Acidobacteriota bacterium]